MAAQNWIPALGFAAIGYVAVIAFAVITRVPEKQNPSLLSQDEIVRLGATKAMWSYCNINFERTWKADDINRRAVAATQQAAIARAMESFKNTDCYELLARFPDMMERSGEVNIPRQSRGL